MQGKFLMNLDTAVLYSVTTRSLYQDRILLGDVRRVQYSGFLEVTNRAGHKQGSDHHCKMRSG